jgi:uncharacterized protein YhaN
MRINRLDLVRYGKFTGAAVDFGPKPASGPDLHVVYGPNEAGKSTLFASVLDLLFGIENKSPYNFLHAYSTMRIGASLHLDGRDRMLVRVKRNQNSLLDENDAPVSEAALQGAIGGIGREACRTMFSLDDETLERGGESILASKGDLGQLLFSASAGLADLSAKLESLEGELAEFHVPRAQKSGLARMKKELDELKSERQAVDVQASAFAGLVEARSRTAAAYGEACDRLAEATARRDQVAAVLEALPLMAERQRLADELAAADDAGELEGGEEAGAAVEQLAAQRSVYVKARQDLPNRLADRDASEDEVRGHLERIGRDNEMHPRRLVIGAADAGVLEELIASRASLGDALKAAREEDAAAKRALSEADAAAQAEGCVAEGPALEMLKSALAAVRAGDPAAQVREARRRAADAQDRLADAMAALHPWTGDVDALMALAVPTAGEVLTAGAALAEAAKTAAAAQESLQRLEADLARHRAGLAALGDPAILADGAGHAAIRATREALWAAHRKALDAGSAEAFEAAMRRDDTAMEARLSQAAEVARLAQVRLAVATTEADCVHAEALAKAAETRLSDARGRLAGMVLAVSSALPPAMSAEALDAWIRLREAALAARAAHRDAQRALAEATSAGEGLRRRMLAALTDAGLSPRTDGDLAMLAAMADDAVQHALAVAARGSLRAKFLREEEARGRALAAAEAAFEAWSTDWRKACAACWLGELDPAPTPGHVAQILATLSKLESALLLRAERWDRLEKLERDIAQFKQDVAAALDPLGIEVGEEPLEALRIAGERVAVARRSAQRQEHLRRRIKEIEGDLLRRLRVATMDAAQASLAGVDAEALAGEAAGLALRVADLDKARLAAFHAQESAQKALDGVGGDARAALLDARRATLLTGMEEESRRYLRLRLGAMAVQQALRGYRDRHRSSMMLAASEAFRIISRGAYRSLETQSAGGQETLVAIAADGASKEASALSKGTRFQLYLALRVAGHREFARERTPLPFILDDIMETFDDFRAEEAFRLLAGMAELGQVVYLTHHRHLCDIARNVCPHVRVHELPGA